MIHEAMVSRGHHPRGRRLRAMVHEAVVSEAIVHEAIIHEAMVHEAIVSRCSVCSTRYPRCMCATVQCAPRGIQPEATRLYSVLRGPRAQRGFMYHEAPRHHEAPMHHAPRGPPVSYEASMPIERYSPTRNAPTRNAPPGEEKCTTRNAPPDRGMHHQATFNYIELPAARDHNRILPELPPLRGGWIVGCGRVGLGCARVPPGTPLRSCMRP